MVQRTITNLRNNTILVRRTRLRNTNTSSITPEDTAAPPSYDDTTIDNDIARREAKIAELEAIEAELKAKYEEAAQADRQAAQQRREGLLTKEERNRFSRRAEAAYGGYYRAFRRVTEEKQRLRRLVAKKQGKRYETSQQAAARQQRPFSSEESRQRKILGIKPKANLKKGYVTQLDVIGGGAMDRAIGARIMQQQVRNKAQKNEIIAARKAYYAEQRRRKKDAAIGVIDRQILFDRPALFENTTNNNKFARSENVYPLPYVQNATGRNFKQTPTQNTIIDPKVLRNGRISAAPPRSTVGEVAGEFKAGFVEGLLGVGVGGESQQKLRERFARYRATPPTLSRTNIVQSSGAFGFLASLPATALEFGAEAKVVQKATPIVGKVLNFERLATKAPRGTRWLFGATATAARTGVLIGGTYLGSQAVSYIKSTPREREFLRTEGKQSLRLLSELQQEKANKIGVRNILGFAVSGGGLASDINPLLGTYYTKGNEKERLQDYYENQGYSRQEAIFRTRTARAYQIRMGIGETVGLVFAETGGEAAGRLFQQLSFKVAAKRGVSFTEREFASKMFALSTPAIGVAGFIEGAYQPIITNTFRAQDKSKRQVAREALVFGGLGSVTAGLAGGTLASLGNRPVKQRALRYTLNVLDPYEVFGDVTQEGIELLGKQPKRSTIVFRTKALTPDFSFTPTTTNTKSSTPTSIKSKTKAARTPTSTNLFSFTPTMTQTQSYTPVNINNFLPTFAFTSTNTNIPTSTNTQTKTETNVQTNVQTITSSFVNVPTTAFVPPLFFPVIPAFGSFGGGKGRYKTRKKRNFKTSRSAVNLVFGIKGIDPNMRDITGLLPRGL